MGTPSKELLEAYLWTSKEKKDNCIKSIYSQVNSTFFSNQFATPRPQKGRVVF